MYVGKLIFPRTFTLTGNVEHALALLKASTQWRLNEKIDNLLEWIPSQHLVRDYPIEFAGIDRDGSPVWVVPFGKCNVRSKEINNQVMRVTF